MTTARDAAGRCRANWWRPRAGATDHRHHGAGDIDAWGRGVQPPGRHRRVTGPADLKRFVDSTTSRWSTSREKVWALFYWGHILKRQTGPIVLHGSEVTDPIRNFSDYGFTMCSTITGINQSLYEAIGLSHQDLGHLQSHRLGGRVPTASST